MPEVPAGGKSLFAGSEFRSLRTPHVSRSMGILDKNLNTSYEFRTVHNGIRVQVAQRG